MADAAEYYYYAAATASAASMVAWLVSLAGVGYTVYALVATGPVALAALLTVVAAIVAATAAKLEHRFYDSYWELTDDPDRPRDR